MRCENKATALDAWPSKGGAGAGAGRWASPDSAEKQPGSLSAGAQPTRLPATPVSSQ